MDTNFKEKSREVLENSLKIFYSSSWKLEKKTNDGSQVFSCHHPSYGKIFKISAIVNFSPKTIIDEFTNKYKQVPKWNTTIKEFHKIEQVDEYTDIIYLITKDAAKGFISSRDYVDIRTHTQKDGDLIIASQSVMHPSKPPNTKYIRGLSGPTCIILSPMKTNSNQTLFQFMVNTNLCGWIPQYVVDKSMTTMLFEYVGCLNKYSKRLQEDN